MSQVHLAAFGASATGVSTAVFHTLERGGRRPELVNAEYKPDSIMSGYFVACRKPNPGFARRVLAGLDHRYAVHSNVRNADGDVMRIVGGGRVADFLRVEDHDVRLVASRRGSGLDKNSAQDIFSA